jgi:hypothetical protein
MPMNPRLLVPRATFDADAAAYLRAVEAADGQALETPVKRAVDDFFRGTKADGTFSAIKAACLLCGARTLAGALTPLAGTAPTNNNFVDADYNRETGLVGNGSTKSLNTNRPGNADPQNNFHLAAYVTTGLASGGYVVAVGVGGATNPAGSRIGVGATGFNNQANRSQTNTTYSFSAAIGAGFIGSSRSTSASFVVRGNGQNETFADASAASSTEDFRAFARTNGSNLPASPGNHRAAFYSIGTSLDLALLDSRVTALVTSIGAAI